MKNPLDTDQVFSVELMNPNPTSSKTKDGPKYRVSFEMHQDAWQMFMDANTNGMILEMQGRVQEKHTDIPTIAEECLGKGGPLSIEAAQWCHQEGPNRYAIELGYADFQHMIYDHCDIKTRRELDHNHTAALIWYIMKENYSVEST
jgi:hypothetical protein